MTDEFYDRMTAQLTRLSRSLDALDADIDRTLETLRRLERLQMPEEGV